MKHRLFQLQIKNKQVRSYATLDNAIVGAIKVARDQLKVMETLVVYHKDTGLELGTVRLNSVGNIVAKWNWEI